jgi:hypothetical protein
MSRSNQMLETHELSRQPGASAGISKSVLLENNQ